MEISSSDIQKVLTDAYKTGHAWNPAYPSLRNLDLAAVEKMNGTERDAKDLVASRQASDINADVLVYAFHSGRKIQYDGDIGPATLALVNIPRCPLPDHPPPVTASFDYGDEELNGAVRSYAEFAEYVGGTGSWPKGCDPDHPNVHSVVTLINAGGASASQKEKLTEVLKYVEACEAEIGQHLRHVVTPNTYSKPNHNIVFGPIPGSVIGFNYFPTPNTCNQTVQGKIDSTFGASAITLANLFTHEYKGHGDGLEHTRGGIMNPSIITINPLSWIGDPHEKTKKRYFGGVPVPTDNPPPPPPPPTGDPKPVSSFTLEGKEYDIYAKGRKLPPIVIEV
jgi:hypothetical protein